MKEQKMQRKPLDEKVKEKERLLITFLKQTREGKYAPIDESSLPYSRLKEETEFTESLEEEFYYGVS
jgi:hypothetical protein